MFVRELINKLELEKKQLSEEKEMLENEIKELKNVNLKLTKELNFYKEKDTKIEKVDVSKKLKEKFENRMKPVEETLSFEPLVEEEKPKRSRKKKEPEEEVIN